ncbi:MAG: hypothetical protein KDC54_17850, partial [Lewinella sp.]|nr:hypothetical protein [Lewinella sp.]
SRAAYDKNIHLDEVGLIVGRRYVVYGIAFRGSDGLPWYLVCENDDDGYPTPQLGEFFDLEDGSVPEGWKVAMNTNAGDFAILPSGWADDPRFMEKLVDGETEAVTYFRSLRAAFGELHPGS